MERCFNEPVLREVPSCKHPYISHSYIRPCGGGNVPLWNQSLAMLCLCLGPRLKRRGTMHIVRRAETQIEQMEPTWFDKLRRACGLQRFDVVARIAMSLKDVETAMEMIHALAFECFKQRSSFLRAILREFRLLNVSPDLAVELFRNTEQWFRAQSPRIAEWNEILYALVLANHYEEAWELVTSMEKGLDPRLPVPLSSTYSILFMLTAQHEGPSATAQLFARQRHIVGASRNPLQHLIMAAIYVSADNSNLDMAKKHVRQGERLMRQLRSCPEPFKENKYLLEYLYATLMAGYRRLGRLQDCFTLFGVMQQHAGQPNQVVFAILQQACWGHLDATSEVRQILRLMEDMQVQPGTVNYNALIKTHSDSGQFTNALSVANRLREAGVAWDDFTYRYLLLAAVGAGQVELGVRLLSQMRSDGVRPSSKQYITVFLGLAQAGYYEDAARVFERLVSLGSCGTQAYNVMIGIHCRRNNMEAAMTLMERMKEANMGPDVMSFRILLEGYAYQGNYEEILRFQSVISTFRANLQQVARDVSCTTAAREVAEMQLQRQRTWTKVYDLLIDARLWNGEWSKAAALLKDVVEMGFPVDVVKHRRLLQDLKDFYGGSDGALGILAEVVPEQTLSLEEEMDPEKQRQRQWLARVPTSDATLQGISTEVAMDYFPLQAFAASFSPHWLDGAATSRGRNSLDLPELCKDTLLSDGVDTADSIFDASTAYEMMHAYYHATVHRRSVLPFPINRGDSVHVRAMPCETFASLRELFEQRGWPTKQPNSPRYVFLRPNGFTLDAFLVLLGLAASYPQSIILLREAPAGDAGAELPVTETTEGAESAELPVLTKQSLQRQWSRALAVTIGATIRGFPLALLLNSRTLLATGDLNDSCETLEKKLRNALTGRDQTNVEEFEQIESSTKMSTSQAWEAWLRRQGLSRLLRHDSRRFLRMDGLNLRAARAETCDFRVKGMADGQVDVEL